MGAFRLGTPEEVGLVPGFGRRHVAAEARHGHAAGDDVRGRIVDPPGVPIGIVLPQRVTLAAKQVDFPRVLDGRRITAEDEFIGQLLHLLGAPIDSFHIGDGVVRAAPKDIDLVAEDRGRGAAARVLEVDFACLHQGGVFRRFHRPGVTRQPGESQ